MRWADAQADEHTVDRVQGQRLGQEGRARRTELVELKQVVSGEQA
jgi:hypothetical protein